MLALRGAPRDGWVGQGVFGGLLRASDTGGPGGVARCFSPTSYQSGQAYREEGSVTP